MLQTKKIDGLTGKLLKDCVCGKYEPLNETHSKCKNCHGQRPDKITTFGNTINASFSNPQQDALSKLMRDHFMEATTPASEEDIKMKLEEEDVKYLID